MASQIENDFRDLMSYIYSIVKYHSPIIPPYLINSA